MDFAPHKGGKALMRRMDLFHYGRGDLTIAGEAVNGEEPCSLRPNSSLLQWSWMFTARIEYRTSNNIDQNEQSFYRLKSTSCDSSILTIKANGVPVVKLVDGGYYRFRIAPGLSHLKWSVVLEWRPYPSSGTAR